MKGSDEITIHGCAMDRKWFRTEKQIVCIEMHCSSRAHFTVETSENLFYFWTHKYKLKFISDCQSWPLLIDS